MKNIFSKLFIILIVVLICISIYSLVNKYNIIKDICDKKDKLLDIDNYSYIVDNNTKIVKKNNDIRVDSYRDNTIQYYDSEENKLYSLNNENMERCVFENGNEHIFVQLNGVEFINESIFVNLFTTKVSESYSEYYITIDLFEYTVDKETGVLKRVIWLDTNDVYEYIDYKFNDEVEEIVRPEVEKYTDIKL